MKYLITFAFCLHASLASTQIEAVYLQYWENLSQRNPAQLVSGHNLEAGAFSTHRWLALDNHLQTHSLYAGALIEKLNTAVGIRAAYHITGGESRSWTYLQLNHKITLGELTIVPGVEAGMYQLSLNGTGDDEEPQLLPGQSTFDRVFDAGFGLKMSYANWWIDISVLHVNSPSFVQFARYIPEAYNLTIGGELFIKSDMMLLTSATMMSQGDESYWIGNATLKLSNAVMVGVSFHSQSELIFQQFASRIGLNGGVTIGNRMVLLVGYQLSNPLLGSSLEAGVKFGMD